MKKFDIITEADARLLERGATVELARGGHITPLARDTLRERRITVVEEGLASADHLSLVPRADIRSLAIGGDRSGAALRRTLATFLRGRGQAVQELGPEGSDPGPARTCSRSARRSSTSTKRRPSCPRGL